MNYLLRNIYHALPKYIRSQSNLATKSTYEMPEYYQNTFYLANSSFLDNSVWYLYNAAETGHDIFSKEQIMKTGIDYQIKSFQTCRSLLELNIPLERDSGNLEIVKAYCAQHASKNNVYLAGLRLCPGLKKSHIEALAFLNTLKNSCVDIPFGGAHCGINIDPTKYNMYELERLISTFTSLVTQKGFLGTNVNIIQPDINCNSHIINWISQKYNEIEGQNKSTTFTCIPGESKMSGDLNNYMNLLINGIFYALDSFIYNKDIMDKLNLNIGWNKKTFLIKGFGKMSTHLAQKLCEAGAICVGICEKDTSYYDKNGLNLKEAIEYKNKYGTLRYYFKQLPPYNEHRIMFEDCDIFLLSAAHKTLTCYNTSELKPKIIIELANGGITPVAHKMLQTKGKLIIPDIYLNSVSSILSYFEYIRNVHTEENLKSANGDFSSNNFSSSDFSKLSNLDIIDGTCNLIIQSKISTFCKEILQTLKNYNLDLDVRTAAYIIALKKLMANEM